MLSPELIHSALESAPDAMIVIDGDGRILFANRQLAHLFGYEPAEAVSLRVEQLMPDRFRARHLEHRRRFLAAERVRPMGVGLELYARRKDGAEFPVEISLSPIHDGERVLVAAAIRDVTERQRIQSELIAARQIADRARELADRANRAKSRFLATASHDLRQPLQSLALLNGTLRRMVDDADAREALEHQEQAIGAMSHLLNALLDISKLESGAIKPQPSDFALGELFEELRVEFSGVASSRSLALEVACEGEAVHTDRALLGQILRNLLSNAIKYTPAGSVRLSARPCAAGTRIEVTDTGIGIAADQIPYIFDEFYQVGVAPHSTREGYGLGLSIVRRLVSLLGVRIETTSEPGKGSQFALELLPARERIEPAREPAPAAATDARRGRPCVLLVEDDPAVRDATRMLLKVEGYQVLTAASLAEAEACARGHGAIDLLITDYHLSRGETGLEVIAALRKLLGPGLKAVLMTGDTSAAVRNLAGNGQLRIASKPIRANELLGMLRELLAG
jgi:PAS domain S-box-containing protein